MARQALFVVRYVSKGGKFCNMQSEEEEEEEKEGDL
jgi:hypothetical protein